jgi:hypothetical protein
MELNVVPKQKSKQKHSNGIANSQLLSMSMDTHGPIFKAKKTLQLF